MVDGSSTESPSPYITIISDDHRQLNPAEICEMRTRIFTSLPSNLRIIKISIEDDFIESSLSFNCEGIYLRLIHIYIYIYTIIYQYVDIKTRIDI